MKSKSQAKTAQISKSRKASAKKGNAVPEEMANSTLFIKQSLQLQKILADAKNGLTLEEIGKKLGVHPRTVNRYLATLRASGVRLSHAVDLDASRLKRWMLPSAPLKPEMFNHDEVAALYLACRFLQPLGGTFLGESADEILKKIRRRLEPQHEQRLEKMLRLFYIESSGWVDYHDKFDLIDTLMIACEDSCEVKIEYQSGKATAPEAYNFQPYELIYREGSLLVIGYSCKSQGIRTLKIERLHSVEPTKRTFAKPKDFAIEKYFASAMRYFSDPNLPVQQVRFRVYDKVLARHLSERAWHKTQKIRQQKDGSCIVEFTVQLTPDLTARLLGLGKSIEVLEPSSLRQEIVGAIKEMRERYS